MCFVEGPFCNGRCWLPSKFVGKTDLGGRQLQRGSNSASTECHVPRECGPDGELFCFLIQELEKMPGSETFGPFYNADIRTLLSLLMSSRRALVALHVVAEEGRDGEVGCRAPGLGTNGRISHPKSPMWESEGEVWSKLCLPVALEKAP